MNPKRLLKEGFAGWLPAISSVVEKNDVHLLGWQGESAHSYRAVMVTAFLCRSIFPFMSKSSISNT